MKTALLLLIATLLSTFAMTSFAQGPRDTTSHARHHHAKKHHAHHRHHQARQHARTN